MEGNIADMGQFIGAGLACIGMGGAGIGVGHVAGNFLSGALGTRRRPASRPRRSSSASPSPRRSASSRSWSRCS